MKSGSASPATDQAASCALLCAAAPHVDPTRPDLVRALARRSAFGPRADSHSEAVIGGNVEVPTPGGPVSIRVPAPADSGTELRLRGRGVPAHDGLAAGDLYAKLNVRLGAPDEALEDFLRNWKPKNPIDPRQGMREQP